MPENEPDVAYLFNLYLVAGGYAYFSVSTVGRIGSEHGRDLRKPSPDVNITIGSNYLASLGQTGYFIRTMPDYKNWLLRRGWAFVLPAFAQEFMPQWLPEKTCVKSSFSTYTDVSICTEGVLSRQPRGKKRHAIVDRDMNCCLHCGRSDDGTSVMTIHHVRAYSRGGETASSNMVTLCHDCNQAVGTNHLPQLYDIAGIPHGYDFGLFPTKNDFGAMLAAIQFSDNLMNTRCEVW